MAFTYTWNEASPAVGDPANQAHIDMQNIKKSVRERGNVDHNASTGDDTDTWTHRENTAKLGQGAVSGRPAAASANKGHIWFDTNTGLMTLDNGGTWISLNGDYYNTGTAAVTNGSAAVVGTTTDFTKIAAGDVFWLSGATRYYAVGSVTDATHLTLSETYEGITASGQSYYIGRVTVNPQFAPRAGGTLYAPTIKGLTQATAAGEPVVYPVTASELDATVSALLGGIKSGSYTGHNTNNVAVTGVGFMPDFILIGPNNYHDVCFAIRGDASGSPPVGDIRWSLAGSGSMTAIGGVFANAMQYDADGFTLIKNSSQYNWGGTTYYYIAFKAAT